MEDIEIPQLTTEEEVATPKELETVPEPEARHLTFREFSRTLAGTENEVWTKYMQIRFGRQAMSADGWKNALEALKKE